MKVKLVIITSVCIVEGSMYRVGDTRHEVQECTEYNPEPEGIYTKRKDSLMGKWQEVLRTHVEIEAPELDPKQLSKWQLKSLRAQRKELEAEFYASTKRIDDQIASLLAIESK